MYKPNVCNFQHSFFFFLNGEHRFHAFSFILGKNNLASSLFKRMFQLLPKSFVITERSLNMMSAHFWKKHLKQASLQEFCVRGLRRVLGTWQQAGHSLCLHAHLHLSASPGVLLLKSEGSGVQVKPSALWKVWWRNLWEYQPPVPRLGKYNRVADAGKGLICRRCG